MLRAADEIAKLLGVEEAGEEMVPISALAFLHLAAKLSSPAKAEDSSNRAAHDEGKEKRTYRVCKSVGVRFCLGTFNTTEEAARDYAEAAKSIRGNKAKLSFALPPPPITPPPAKKHCMLSNELTLPCFEDYFFIGLCI
ncbi:hypothetical protein CUMW_198400 [Citrus unshiu]|nr:hypothetical protein CUMW_198400 [Citrus unshiu]